MTDVVPQTDPKAGYLAQQADIDAAIQRVLSSGWYILGQEVKAFEAEFAAWVGVAHGVGVANGTDALVVGLKALGVGAGDWVATVSHTAVATVAAIELAGAKPVLVDIDQGYGIDPDQLDAVADRYPLKAIIPVHLYGQPVALDRVLALAKARGIAVLEDCSQAHGAMFGAAQVGSFGALAAYSLYPTKNLGAIGDGGVLVTAAAELAQRLRELREYGWRERYVSDTAGQNSRLDELQAAILRVKLARLTADNARRQAIALAYDNGLAGLNGLGLPWRRPGSSHVFHQYVVTHAKRDDLKAALKARGVMSNVHYPLAVHQQGAYRGRIAVAPGGLPATEKAVAQVLSLPMYPQMTDAQVAQVIAAVRASV